MRKLVETTYVSLDGVIGDTTPSTAPQASPEKWGEPYWSDEYSNYERDLIFAADALLLGRATYEGFSEAWPGMEGEVAERMNGLPKHVASRTLQKTTWNATLVEGDVAEEVARLKEMPGEGILKYGTGELDRTLIEHGLVDEFHFWIHPVAVGAGQHLFDGFDTTHLDLVHTTPFKSGVVVVIFSPK